MAAGAPPNSMDQWESKEEMDQFLSALEDFQPTLPDDLTDFYLRKSGFQTTDKRVIRAVSVAAQKFIADVANEALQHCKVRQANPANKDKQRKDKKLVLTAEDMAPALKAHGIGLYKPEYYADTPGPPRE